MGIVYFTPVCTFLGVVHLIVFVLQYKTSWHWMPYAFPTENALWYQYLTSLILHGDWNHLTQNAFCLFAFGAPLEKKIGSSGLIVIYLISGIGGNFLFSLFESQSVAIGASGAIFGIICSMVFADPKAFVITPGTPLPMPILLFALFYIGAEVMAMRGQTTNIAHAAHVGGGIFGAVVGHFWAKSRPQSSES